MTQEATVTLPDGSRRTLTGTRDEIVAEAERLAASVQKEMQRPKATNKQSFAQNLGESLVGNTLLGVPRTIAKAAQRQTGTELSSLLGILPKTGREAVSSFTGGIQGLLGADPGQSVGQEISRRNQVEQDAPLGAMGGTISGDAASLVLGRMPFMKGKAGGVFDDAVESSLDATSRRLAPQKLNYQQRLAGQQPVTSGPRKFAADIVDSDLFKELARGMGRSAEAGLEGLALATIQDGDPLETAALSAGAQAFASSVSAMGGHSATIVPEILQDWGVADASKGRRTLRGTLGGLVGAGVGLSALVYGLSQIVPGDESMSQSEDLGFGKVAKGMALAFLVTAAGGGRSQPDGVLKTMPLVADAIRTIPRASVISIIEDSQKKEVIDTVTKYPSVFGKYSQQIEDAIYDGTIGEKLDELMERKDFREILEAPHPKLAGVPEK